jgi:putative phosphoribosyl transferase
MVFEDRKAAGRMLAQVLAPFHLRPETIVLALPRGGVPVAYEVAHTLNLPLDIFIVRKLGAPGQEELAMGAIASGGTIVLNQDVIDDRSITEAEIEQVASRERLEIERRESEYRGGRPPLRIDGHTVILIDDGIATGASMRAAARAVPVAAKSTCDELQSEVDQIICVTTPKSFAAISMFYRDFEQTTDEEVRTLLLQASVNQRG